MILHPNIKYRSDIDGLRAIAVLSVIIFHINKDWIPGGFLGVDIFFVISGYLITLILAKEVAATRKINIVNFYKRRIKRIIPALLFVLIPTFLVGFFLFTPDALASLSKSMVWSFFSAANIYFFSSIDTGYFATGSSELPLLHLWSLGVEEQFYILWPFAVLFLLKYVDSMKQIIFIAGVLFIASLVWAQVTIVSDHSFAYYMLPTRAWELLAGAIVALLVHSGFRAKSILNEIMAIIGLLAIVLSFIFVSESDPVPGVAALPAIIGSALLILSGVSHRTYIGKLLSFKIFVAIGLVSYSTYLWHWPILAYLRFTLIDIDLMIAIGVITITFLMATLSYFFIETPLRTNNSSTKSVFLWYFIVPATIIIVISTLTTQAIKHKSEFIYPWSKLNQTTDRTLPAYAYKYNCQFSLFDTKSYTEERCVYPEHIDKANSFLIGDSNAAHYLGILRVFAENYGFSIRNATQSSCPLLIEGEFDWIGKKYQKGCDIYRQTILEEVKKYDTIFIGGIWDSYYPKKDFKKSFEKTIELLSKNVNHVVLLAKVPMFPGYNKDCEKRKIRIDSLNCTNRFNNQLPDTISNTFLSEIAAKYSNVEFFDIRKQICKNGICSPYIDAIPVYYDTGHLSMEGSELVGENMIRTNDPMLHVFDHIKGQKQTYKPHIEIKDQGNTISFSFNPRPKEKKIAFYLYQNDKRVDTQWYSKNFSYTLDKQKYGVGKYRIRYFIVDEKEKSPGKAKKIVNGYSKYVIVQ